MKSTELRQLIRESINEYIRDIDEAGNMAALEAKMTKTAEAIELREKKMNMDGLDEAYHDMLDKGKMKELGSEVKALKKSLTKYEKQLDKLKNKGAKAEKVEEKEIVDEVDIDETFPESGAQLEEDSLNESFLHMQKLAGVITEAQYKAKKKSLIEAQLSPDQAAQASLQIVNKAENDPSIDKLAADIAKNPENAKELMNFLKKQGVNPANLNENTEDAAKKLALLFAKTADKEISESLFEGDGDITGRVMTGLASAFGGAVAAPWLAEKLGMFVTEYVNAFGDKITSPEGWVPFAGAAAGILLTVIGAKVYDLISGN